jgi:rod shape-determining protein MreB
MLQRLLGDRLPRLTRPMVIVTTPVLDGIAYRTRARAAVQVLRPRSVLTVPSALSIALAADADMSRPLIVVDTGAHVTEVVLLCDGAVTDAHRTAVGTGDLDGTTTPEQIVDAVGAMLTTIRRHDRTPLTAGALRRGILLAGGGALRPEITSPPHGSPDGTAADRPGPAHRGRPRRRQIPARRPHPPLGLHSPSARRPSSDNATLTRSAVHLEPKRPGSW